VNANIVHIEVYTRQMIEDFIYLCHFWPVQVKRDRNVSFNMYKVMTAAKASNHLTSLEMSKDQREVMKSDLN